MTDMQTGSATYGAPRHLSPERPEPARPNGYVGRRRAPETLSTSFTASPVQPEQIAPVAAVVTPLAAILGKLRRTRVSA